MTNNLEELRRKIERQVPQVGRSPYSTHIVSLALGLIERDYGYIEANGAIEDFGLDALGWTKAIPRVQGGAPVEVEAEIESHETELQEVLAHVAEWSQVGDFEKLERALDAASSIVHNLRHLKQLAERERVA
jgi:hypothetical protein